MSSAKRPSKECIEVRSASKRVVAQVKLDKAERMEPVVGNPEKKLKRLQPKRETRILKKGTYDEKDQPEGAGRVNKLVRRCKTGVQPRKETRDARNGTEQSGSNVSLTEKRKKALSSNADPLFHLKQKFVDKHYAKTRTMSNLELREQLNIIVPVLKQIKRNQRPCRRYDIFVNRGRTLELMGMRFVEDAFTLDQSDAVFALIDAKVYKKHDISALFENFGFRFYVLQPEALIRIYARVNSITFQTAYKELRFGAKYEGPIPDDLLET
ncbi:unnamed protein product [Orchesella dallaii]|uniref:Uncharacterized protein n=1 Tax=Orchesella dallaii TaxID=48710 RepID=A0ABP1RSP4_9HEXA